MSTEIDGVVYIIVPWLPGLNEFEEDSPGFYDFWAPSERSVNNQVDEAKSRERI